MNLIRKIEVNYLRSLYTATIDKVGDLNVLFGRNDSGKSNVLRALNLFFNDEIEPDQELDFEIDMSDYRKREARDAKGRQFIWIKIGFNIPPNYKNSLGSEITIKRQWNRGGEMTQSTFQSGDTEKKQPNITKFLNSIDFTYIPAIKDINVYSDLIERMYGAAAETEELKTATASFVEAIAGRTTSLSSQLNQLFGGPAKVAPPTEMRQLFRSLDFAHGDEGHSLLRQKGDGVKARHLPEILRFINENEAKKKIFLWGFEEPENSLDLCSAESEALRFAKFAARDDTQVFITSHSPAFYLAHPEHSAIVRRYFITRQTRQNSGPMQPPNAATLIDRLEEAETLMEQAGLLQLPFIIRKMSEHRETLKEKEDEAEQLRKELERLRRPTLFVEGEHDVKLFRDALCRSDRSLLLDIKPLGGTPQSAEALLGSVLQQGGIHTSAPTFFLFDNDKAGRGAARKLNLSVNEVGPKMYKENTYVWALPVTEKFRQFARKMSLQEDQFFFTAEFLYPVEAAAAICLELTEKRNDEEILMWRRTISGNYWPMLGQETCQRLQTASAGSAEWFYARGVPTSLKTRFAEVANERGLDTNCIDEIVQTVCNRLIRTTPNVISDQ